VRFSFDRKYAVALVVGALVLAALSIAGWRSVEQMRAALALARDTHLAQRRFEDVYRTLLDLETSQRGYLLTHEAPYLEPYRLALARLDHELGVLISQQAGHAEQAPHLLDLRGLIQGKLAELAQTLELRDTRGLDAALAAMRNDEGKLLMDRIRQVLERMDLEDERVLAEREAEADAAVARNVRLAAAAVVGGGLLLLAIQLLMRRELAARRRAEAAEAGHRDALEGEVAARTAELALSEARLRGIFDSATDAILTVDESQRIVMANPAAARMLRLAPEKLHGAALADFVPERSRARHHGLVTTFGAAPAPARPMSPQREVSGLRADGTEFPIEAAISHLEARGQHLYTVILRDISERKRAEAELRASEARLRNVLAQLPEAVVVHTGGRIGFVNEAAERLFGADESLLLGRAVAELMAPEFAELMRQRIASLEAGTPAVGVAGLQVRRLDGSVRDVEASAVRLAQHGEVSVLSLIRDITEARRTQAALGRSEARFRDVLMHLPEPVFIRSDNHIAFVNRAALALFGVDDESQVIGRTPLDFCHHDDRAAAQARIDALHRDPHDHPPSAEATVQRPDGTTRVAEVQAAPVEFQGRNSVIVMLRDLSELRRTQRDLASSYKDLQRLISQQDRVQEEERKRIARELHDDLQQRLAAILINVSAAAVQLRRDPDSAERALAAADELAGTAIDSTRRIVKDLRPQMLDELGLVAALEALAAQFTEATGIACDVHADERARDAADAPLKATCLYRVAQESLNNVAKHARASQVELRLSLAGPDPGPSAVGGAEANEQLSLRVCDNGQGMPRGTPGGTLAAAARKPESFGLLGMTERLRMLGGTLQVQSTPGKGTVVEARLPVREPATEPM
jgi:PAS domain S-box-containing protein